MDYTDYGTMLISEAPEATILGFLAGLGVIFWVISLAIAIFKIVCLWKVYVKAGKPGWASLIPIYNFIVYLNIVGLSGWYILILCIPIVNLIFGLYLEFRLAKSFGKSGAFAVGLILLNTIFVAILAFGDAKYVESSKENA